MASERRLNLRFSPERFDKMEQKRSRERLSFQEIGVRLFESWLASDGDQLARGGLRRPADRYLERLAMLMATGDEGLLSMVKKAIDVSYGILQHSHSADEIDRLRAVAYGEAPKPEPKPAVVRPRGRPPKIA